MKNKIFKAFALLLLSSSAFASEPESVSESPATEGENKSSIKATAPPPFMAFEALVPPPGENVNPGSGAGIEPPPKDPDSERRQRVYDILYSA